MAQESLDVYLKLAPGHRINIREFKGPDLARPVSTVTYGDSRYHDEPAEKNQPDTRPALPNLTECKYEIRRDRKFKQLDRWALGLPRRIPIIGRRGAKTA